MLSLKRQAIHCLRNSFLSPPTYTTFPLVPMFYLFNMSSQCGLHQMPHLILYKASYLHNTHQDVLKVPVSYTKSHSFLSDSGPFFGAFILQNMQLRFCSFSVVLWHKVSSSVLFQGRLFSKTWGQSLWNVMIRNDTFYLQSTWERGHLKLH